MSFAQAAPKARFRFGDALQSTFDAIFANVPVFALLALVIYAAPNFVAAIAFGPPSTDPGMMLGGGLFRGLVGLATSALLQGALVRGVVIHLNGARPRFAECLRSGLTAAVPLVLIGLIFGIAVGFGLILLLAPGLFLIALWGVSAPAAVIEKRGVFGALSRSADLTAGHRWGVLGALIVMGILSFVFVMIGSGVVGLVGGVALFAGGGASAAAAAQGWGVLIVISAVSAVTTALGAIFSNAAPAAIYYELRRSKEGAAPAQLAAVFD